MKRRIALSITIALGLWFSHAVYVDAKCTALMTSQWYRRQEIMKQYVEGGWSPQDLERISQSLVSFDRTVLKTEGCLK